MKIQTNDTKADNTPPKRKKIRTEKMKIEQKEMNGNVNGEAKISNKYNNSSTLKRSLSCEEDKVIKKRKKRNKALLSPIDENVQESTQVVDREAFEKSNGKLEINDPLKSTTDNQNDEEMEHDKNSNKPNEELNGKFLRVHLNSPDGLDMLRKFVKICNENKERDLATEYLDAGGSILEILRLLSSTDKKNITAVTVFSAVRILLIKILVQYPQHHSSAEGACRHIINSHLPLIHSMLSLESNAKQRKAALKFLAALVSLGGDLPRELLVHLNLSLDIIKSLVKHTKPTDEQNTRNCFIHFILAFLIEGNASVIKAVLDKRDLLSSIFPDMIYDSKDIVILVITTLTTYILKNPKISKTMKLYIFSTSAIQNLVCLYNWKGPYNWKKNKSQDITLNPEYLQQKEVVVEVVHDFLITLLTSHRYGIVFHDRTLGTSHGKHNHLVNLILQSLSHPWEHEKPSDLVIKILAASPDLIKSQFVLLESYIEPRVSIKWLAAMRFVKKIIESVDAEACLKTCSSELSKSQLSAGIISLTLPGTILKSAIVPSLAHSNIIVRHEAILVLTSMFEQLQKYLSVIKAIYSEDIDFNAFEHSIINYTIKNAPNLNMILSVWNSTFVLSTIKDDLENKEPVSEPKKHEHLTAVLDLLHVYNEVIPKSLYTLSGLQSNKFLNTLNQLEDTDATVFNTIKVKAIQFLVLLNPFEFSPQKEIFSNALSFLISLLNKETLSISSRIKTTIKVLLNATGMFEGCMDQLDIWINGFVNLDEKERVIKWFVDTIKKTAENIEKYVNEIIETEENVNRGITQPSYLENIFDELIDKNTLSEGSGDILRMQNFTSVSPLLYYILCKMKKNSYTTVSSYVSYILVHTLHYQVAPECLLYLCSQTTQEFPVKKYLLSWLLDEQPDRMKTVSSSMTLLSEINLALSSETEMHINEIFNGDRLLTFKYNGKDITINYTLSGYEITYLFKMAIFYFTQFIKKGVLTKTKNENCKVLITSLLYIAKECSDDLLLVEECAKSIFTHPTIVYYFSPFYQKSKDVAKSIVTLTVVDLCKVIINLCDKRNIRKLFSHFRNKLLFQLCDMIDKHKKSDKITDVDTIITLLELLQLTSQDVVYLLQKVVKLESSMFLTKDNTNFSIYGYIFPKLLEIASSDKSEHDAFFKIDSKFIEVLCSHLRVLKSSSLIDVEQWEATLCGYLSKFPFNIAGISTSFFQSLLSMKITNTTVRLISFLISKHMKFISAFTKYMMKSEKLKESDIVFPIISSNLNFKWDRDLLQKLKHHYAAEIKSYLCNPNNIEDWIEKNVAAVSYLIKNTFDDKACKEINDVILRIGDKLDMVSIQYVQILQSLYNKYATYEDETEKSVMNLMQVLLHIITLTLKKESKNIEKLNVLCKGLNDAVKQLRNQKSDFIFEALSDSRSWIQFTRFSLKLGLKESKNDEQSVPILKTLSILCNISYKDDSDNEYAKTLFEMATSHSEFINIMLESSNTKRDLLELLWTLMQKNKTVIALAHVPVYLAAYTATLSEADQYILSILNYYESNNININEYRPYLWGSAAAIHYSVKGEAHTALWRQPTTTQILNLFAEDTVNNTIKYYPVNRALKYNELFEAHDNVYDPAFYLPLLCSLLSENNVVSCHRMAQSGALALAFIACSSKHADVRMMAYTAIAKYYTHLETVNSKSKLLWMRLIDALRNGIVYLQSQLNDVQLSCLVTTFLARTSLISTNPLNPLFAPLQLFLMAKPALDLKTIPELLQLLHSSDVKHKAHRHWILENIRDGMKTEIDSSAAFKCVLFKLLFDFYTCSLSDTGTKKLILQVIDATLKIKRASIILVEGYALLPWLLQVSKSSSNYEVQYIEILVKILEKLTDTILSMKGGIIHYKLMLLNVTLNIKIHLYNDIKLHIFTSYISSLEKLLAALKTKNIKSIVTKEHITEILTFSKKLLGPLDECEDMLRYGCDYITKTDHIDDENEIEVARDCFRTMVWTWCSNKIR